jgi:DNA-binding PadR family transcriptional regulator
MSEAILERRFRRLAIALLIIPPAWRGTGGCAMPRSSIQEPTFLILTALAAGPQHGYGIMTDVADISGDRVKLRAGTLYAALDRLRADGIVDVDREEIFDSRLRRYYKLTQTGAAVLAEEASRMTANASIAATRLRTHPAGA